MMEVSELPRDKKIIVFDGICNLCDRTVQYIIKHDRNDVFRFVARQSQLGQKLLKHIGIDEKHSDSIILYEPGRAYFYKSDAAFEIAKNLGGIFTAASFFAMIPKSVRNRVYDHIARNRYKTYGKRDQCAIPTPELATKFLD